MKTTVALSLSVLFLVALDSFSLLGSDLDLWRLRNPFPTGNSLSAVTFGANRFVVGGEFGIAATSFDGLNWTPVDTGVTNTVNALIFGDNLFVSVGEQGTILTSNDGLSWTVRVSGTTNRLTGVAYGNGRYVAVGTGNTAVISTNGLNWTVASVTNAQPVDITFGNGLFAATTTGNAFVTTVDGSNWNSVALPGSGGLAGVVFGNGTFVSAGYIIGPPPFRFETPVHWISTNGADWAQGSTFTGALPPQRAVMYGNGVFVSVSSAVNGGTTIGISTNGFDWSAQTNVSFVVNATYQHLVAGVFGNGTFLLAGASGFTLLSSNGLHWYAPIVSHDLLTDIQYANGVYVAIGGFWPFPAGTYGPVPGPTLLVSTNGHTFAPAPNEISHPLSSIAVGNGTFVVVGTAGGLYRSTDGLSWISRGSGTLRDLHGVTYGNGTFVAVGEEGTIITSPNGLVWTLRFSGSAYPLYDVTYANGLYVVVGHSGTVLTSSDTVNWTAQFADTTNSLLSVAGGNGVFVATGEAGTIMTGDGSNWVSQVTEPSMALAGVTFGSGGFLIVGRSGNPLGGPLGNVTLVSTNGVNWVQPNPPRTITRLHAAAYLNGAYWLVGENGTILESGAAATLRLAGQWQSTNGAFELRSVGGQPAEVYRLEVRTDLSSSWTNLVTLTNGPAGMYFLDQQAHLRSSGFYRLVSP